jgi:hypothetical protein
MKKMKFLDIIRSILEENKAPLSYMEILEIAEKKGYSEELIIEENQWGPLIEFLYRDVRDNPNSPFEKIGSKPARFVLKNVLAEYIVRKAEAHLSKSKYRNISENILHSYLVYHNYNLWNMYTKTIFYGQSTLRKYSKWLHPNLVGVQLPKKNNHSHNIFNIKREVESFNIKFSSFNVHKEINFSNLREAFFQTVSTSSWANESYMASFEIDEDEDLMGELRRLSSHFGIGIIKLDIYNPDASKILFSARHRNIVDWDTINKLSNQNSDFKILLLKLENELPKSDIQLEWFDNIYDKNNLLKMVKI